MPRTSRTAEDNAAEFGRHERFGGWALAILVACSVEPAGHGGDRRSTGDRPLKMSATAFARLAGTDHKRILRYFEAWGRAAEERIVPPAASLTPGDVDAYELPEGYDWRDYYEGGVASVGSAIGIIDRRMAAGEMTPLQRQRLRAALDDADRAERELPTRPTGRLQPTAADRVEPYAEDRDVIRRLDRAVVDFAERVHLAGRNRDRKANLMRGGMLASGALQDAVERCGTFTEEELESLLEGGD